MERKNSQRTPRTVLPSALLTLAFSLVSAGAGAQTSASLVSVDPYGNFHAAGVEVVIAGDSNGDAAASLEWRRAGEAGFRAAHPLVRIQQDVFAGSLFDLAPGEDLEVRVTLTDPDGVTGDSSATAAFSTRPAALVEPAGRTLYVAPGGDNQNPGTDPDQPLLTVQRSADLAVPGDLILIAPGVYRESVDVPTSGLLGQPIVFQGVFQSDGAGAILDGADAAIAAGVSWAAEGGGTFSLVTGFPTGHVVSDLGRLFQYDDLADLTTLGAGFPGGFFFDGSRLFVRFADGSDPALHTMHVARHEDGFFVNGRQHIRIENLEIRHYGSGSFGKGVYLRFSSDCAVRQCRIHEIGKAGVWIKGGSTHLVEDNEIWDTSIFDWPWDWTKGSSAENNAITLTDDPGRGHVIRGNRIHGTFNGVGPCGGSPPANSVTTEVDIYGNHLSQHTDDAFEPEGHCSNVRLWDNLIEDSHMAFAVAPAAPGPTFIVRNVAFNIGNTRTSQIDGFSSSGLKINSGFPTLVGPLFLYHNTFLTEAPATNAITLLNPGTGTLITSRNNVFAGTRYVLDKVNPTAIDWDWDALHTTDPSRFVRWEGARHQDLASLAAATGQELHGLSAVPALTDPANGDFTPASGSPLVDSGVVIPGINDGFLGAGPDRGACERAVEIFNDGFESGDTSAWSATAP